jgi:hypothetical protein
MADKFDVFTRLVGGEDNLPPRLPTPPPQPASGNKASFKDRSKDIVDAFGNLQIYDDFVRSGPRSQAPGRPYQRTTNRSQGNGRTEVDPANFTLDPRKGEPAEIGTSFCPFLAISKFPYKYVDQFFRQPIASAHFDEGKIYNRKWDL